MIQSVLRENSEDDGGNQRLTKGLGVDGRFDTLFEGKADLSVNRIGLIQFSGFMQG